MPKFLEEPKLLFLCSYPKSGNTWFRTFFRHYLDESLDINELKDSHGASWMLMDKTLGFPAELLSQEELALLRPKIYRALWNQNMKPSLIKLHDAYNSRLLPTGLSRVIHLVRDPLDVAVSFAHHLREGDLEQAVSALNHPLEFPSRQGNRLRQVRQQLGTWAQHTESWLTASEDLPVLTLRYEDLREDPVTSFGRAIEFMGVEFERARVERAVEATSLAKLQQQEQKSGFKELWAKNTTFFRKGLTGEGNQVLNADQVSRIKAKNGNMMRHLGYLSSSGEQG